MGSYLVELYQPRSSAEAVATASARAQAVAAAMRAEGLYISHVRAFFVPRDETCFHVLEASSYQEVEELARRAHLDYDRIMEVSRHGQPREEER